MCEPVSPAIPRQTPSIENQTYNSNNQPQMFKIPEPPIVETLSSGRIPTAVENQLNYQQPNVVPVASITGNHHDIEANNSLFQYSMIQVCHIFPT